ncbi:MAG: PAS domain S-box protein [Candidatus Hadarchaeum sp.]|uniref:PAS domain S-box protein n=1 Tax=Candidatus Hadarchaeum sp. TaxID=2883567 RepID=UPI003D098568
METLLNIRPEDLATREKGEVARAVYQRVKENITKRMKREREYQLAQERIKRDQEHFQLMINRMPIGMILWDRDFRVRMWNPAATRILGYTEEEAMGKHPYEFMVPKEVQPQIDKVWRRLLEGDLTAHSVNENITKDGRVIVCEWTNTPLRGADGTVIGVLSMFQDVTERRRAEEELKISEERYRSLVEYSTDSIYMLDKELRYLSVNEELLRRLGLPREKVVGRTFGELHTAEETREFAAKVREVFETGRPVQQEHYSERLGRFFLRTISPVKDARTGEVKAVSVVGKDITELKNIKERLQMSEQQLRKIIDSSPDVIAATDLEGNLIEFNQTLLQITGLPREDVMGRKIWDFLAPADRERAEEFAKALKQGALKNVEFTLLTHDGRAIPLEVSVNVIAGPAEEPVSLLFLARDITERKNLERTLRESIYSMYGVSRGECYLIQSSDTASRLFCQLVLHGVPGLCFIRERPEKFLQSGIPKECIVVMSSVPVKGFETIDDLQRVSLRISEFVREHRGSVVLLSGLSYLVSRAGFENVFKFLQEKRFLFMENEANLLIPVDLSTLSEKERALLTSELKLLGQ